MGFSRGKDSLHSPPSTTGSCFHLIFTQKFFFPCLSFFLIPKEPPSLYVVFPAFLPFFVDLFLFPSPSLNKSSSYFPCPELVAPFSVLRSLSLFDHMVKRRASAYLSVPSFQVQFKKGHQLAPMLLPRASPRNHRGIH